MKHLIRKLFPLVSCGAAVMLTSSAQAGIGHGKITKLTVTNGGTHAVINVVGIPFAGKDACATNNAANFIFPTTTDEGKAFLSAATAAYLARKSVAVSGTAGNNCTNGVNAVGGNVSYEDLMFLQVED